MKPVTLCCATDGNHGRSVAFAARRQGCECVVYMHEHAPAAKEAAIRALGARVVRVSGTYDDSVRLARKSAEQEGWVLVADTSDDPLDLTTRHVIQGYGVMVLELLEQLAQWPGPTHVFVQCGVGGLAAAIAGVLADIRGAERPTLIVVEPEAAACVMESVRRGMLSRIGGDLMTAMAMLSAGEASAVAWPVLHQRADAFVAIDDATAIAAARELEACDAIPLDVSASGAAGYAGLADLWRHPEAAILAGLNHESRVLVFGTERR
jgi:diaminopropionate ammonia-lyase